MEFLTSFGNWCSGPGLWHGGGYGNWAGGMPFHFGGIFQLLVIGLIIYFTARLFRKPATSSGPGTPEEVLKRRYAAGEIDEPTYKRMKDELQRS